MPAEPIPRRRLLRLTGVALAGAAIAAWPRRPPSVTWTGQAMGGPAQVTLHGVEEATARRLVAQVAGLVDRMEGLFSLHRPDSVISRLNRQGELGDPPAAFTDLLSRALSVSAATGGAFDPTVQPLWRLYRDQGAGADPASVLDRIDWRGVVVGRDRVRLPPGAALTLNGIAQGYITDRVVDLLAAQGVGHMLVDMGEPRGVGRRDDGGDWMLGVADPDDAARLITTLPVSGRAIATSAPRASLADEAGRIGHIFDPATGRPAQGWKQVSLAAGTAMLADALSTAVAALPRDRAGAVLAGTGGVLVAGV